MLIDLANTHIRKDTRLAREYAQQAARLAHLLNFGRGEARAYHLIGSTFRDDGAYPPAKEYILMGLRIRERLGLGSESGQSYAALGHIAWDGENDNVKAMQYFRKALGLVRAAGDSASLPPLYNHIGLMLKDAGQLDQAIAYIRRAAYLLSQQPPAQHSSLSAFYNNLSKIALQQRRYGAAFGWVNKAMVVNRRFQNWRSQTYSLENAARTYAALGNQAKADALFAQALQLARYLHAGNRERDIYQSLSETNEWNGNYAEALRFYKKFDAKSDSLLNERKNRQLAELQTQFETE